MATATPSQHLDGVTLQPPATNPTQKHHLFWSVWPHQCSHVIRLWAGFYQLIRWYLTHQFDQTVHRVCAASAVKSTAPRWVSVFPLVSIALPHSRLHSNIHRYIHIHCVIIAKTAALLSLNSSVQKETEVYHLCFKWYKLFFHLTKEQSPITVFFFPAEFASWSWVCTHSHLNAQQGCSKRTPQVLNKNCELFHITYSGHIFIKVRRNLQTGYKISETMEHGKTVWLCATWASEQYAVK